MDDLTNTVVLICGSSVHDLNRKILHRWAQAVDTAMSRLAATEGPQIRPDPLPLGVYKQAGDCWASGTALQPSDYKQA